MPSRALGQSWNLKGLGVGSAYGQSGPQDSPIQPSSSRKRPRVNRSCISLHTERSARWGGGLGAAPPAPGLAVGGRDPGPLLAQTRLDAVGSPYWAPAMVPPGKPCAVGGSHRAGPVAPRRGEGGCVCRCSLGLPCVPAALSWNPRRQHHLLCWSSCP